MAALPVHLKPVFVETDEDRELRELLRSDWLGPPRHREAPGEHRRRLLTERHADNEGKGPPVDDDDE